MSDSNAFNASKKHAKQLVPYQATRLLLPVTLLGTVTLLAACGGGSSSSSPASNETPANEIPTVDAGVDQTVAEQSAVALAGVAQDADGDALTLSWSQTSGPEVNLSDAASATPTFTAPSTLQDESLTFEFTASDEDGASASDTVVIDITDINLPPTVSAGEEQSVNEQTLVTLQGEATDLDGDIVSYAWVQTQGDLEVVLNNANDELASFTTEELFQDAQFTFALTVTDDDGDSSTDEVVIHVLDIPSPVRLAVTPAEDSVEVPLDVTVEATFDQAMDPASLSASTFFLEGPAGPVEATLGTDPENDHTIQLDPVNSLGIFTAYKATLSADLKGAQHNSLGDTFVWDFITRDGAWGAALNIENAGADVTVAAIDERKDLQIAMDEAGNAMVVWVQAVDGGDQVFAKRFSVDGGWETESPEVISDLNEEGEAMGLQVAFDSKGNAMVAWLQGSDPDFRIWVNRYAGRWESPQSLQEETFEGSDDPNFTGPSLIVDSVDNAFVAWVVGYGVVVVRRYDSELGWEGTEELDTGGGVLAPRLSIDREDNLLATWAWADEEVEDGKVHYGFYQAELEEWRVAQEPDPESDEYLKKTINIGAGWAVGVQAAFDNVGNVFVVWEQGVYQDPLDVMVRRGEYSVAGNDIQWWDDPINLGQGEVADFFDNLIPQIAVDDKGNAIVVWHYRDEVGRTNRVRGRHYSVDLGTWGEPLDLGDLGGIATSLPRIVMDNAGNAIVVWSQVAEGQQRLMFNRYIAASETDPGQWLGAQDIFLNDDASLAPANPVIGIDGQGRATVVWEEGDSNTVWANQFQ